MNTENGLRDDLLDPEVNHEPHPVFARLREEDPVHFSAPHQGWLITRYDDAVDALLDPRLSSDRVRPLLEQLPEDRRETAGPVMELISRWMVVTDPPEHTRLRRLATGAFHPRKFVAMEDRIRSLVDSYLDSFIASGEQDLVAGFAFPLPATVISELVGAPQEDAERFKVWSQDLALIAFGAGGEVRAERHARAEASIAEMLDYFGELIERERANPGGHNLIADLVAGEDGEHLTDEEMKGMCALFLFAGHETTTTTITSAVKLLIEHPDQMEILRQDPGQAGKAVEESLRVEGAIKVLHRWVVEDLEIRGRQISAGERVLILPAAANRDPDRFVEPDRFDITRSPNPHIAFGKGIHACIGAMLARIEMRIALAAIVERLPGLRFAEAEPEFTWAPTLAARALNELKVVHDG